MILAVLIMYLFINFYFIYLLFVFRLFIFIFISLFIRFNHGVIRLYLVRFHHKVGSAIEGDRPLKRVVQIIKAIIYKGY